MSLQKNVFLSILYLYKKIKLIRHISTIRNISANNPSRKFANVLSRVIIIQITFRRQNMTGCVALRKDVYAPLFAPLRRWYPNYNQYSNKTNPNFGLVLFFQSYLVLFPSLCMLRIRQVLDARRLAIPSLCSLHSDQKSAVIMIRSCIVKAVLVFLSGSLDL